MAEKYEIKTMLTDEEVHSPSSQEKKIVTMEDLIVKIEKQREAEREGLRKLRDKVLMAKEMMTKHVQELTAFNEEMDAAIKAHEDLKRKREITDEMQRHRKTEIQELQERVDRLRREVEGLREK